MKIFSFNEKQNGSLIDSFSKTAGTLTIGDGGFKKTEKGLAMLFDGSATDYDSGVTLAGVKTIVTYIKSSANTKLLLDNGADKLEITGGSYAGTGLTQNYVNNTDTDVALLNQWTMVTSEFSAGIAFATDLEMTPDASTYVARVMCFDTVLTTAERNELYKDFLNSYGTTEQKRNFEYPVASDLSNVEGLVAAYNMIPSKGTLVDISGNGNDGTISGALSTKDGMAFDGVDDYVEVADSDNPGEYFTISMRLKLISSVNRILCEINSNDGISCQSGVISGALLLNISNSYFQTDIGGYNDGQFHSVHFIRSSEGRYIYVDGMLAGSDGVGNPPSYGSSLLLIGGGIGKYPSNSEIQDVQIYNYAFTPQQAKDYHNSFNQVVLRDTFADAGVGDTHTREWAEVSGDGAVSEVVIEQGEKVTNGDFATTSTNGWINAYNTTFNVVNNQLEVTALSIGSAIEYLMTGLKVGSRYRVKWDYITGTGLNPKIRTVTGSDTVIPIETYSTTNNVKEFTSTSTTGKFSPLYQCGTAGTFYFDNVSITEIPSLPFQKTGDKHWVQDTSGIRATQSKKAYGTWEFDLNKGADGNFSSVAFITTGPLSALSRYLLTLTGAETIRFIVGSGTIIMQTAASYIDNNTDYRIKIARLKSAGVFKDIPGAGGATVYDADTFAVFIKGGAYGNTSTGWTLVEADSGSNPVVDATYTTSEFFVTDLDEDDEFSNLKITNEVKQ